MVEVAFKTLNLNIFEEKFRLTIMKDGFDYTSPLALFRKLANILFFQNMTELLETNEAVKVFAESEWWIYELTY